MKGILRIVMGIFIFSIVTMLLFGGNNKYSRQQLTAKFHKTIETKKQIENDRRILPKIDDSHLTIGQTGYHKPDEKMQKKNESPGAKMARHQERMINLEASGTSSEQIIQILKKEKRATGTGSISGSVYQTDGITPLDHSIRIYAYDEYGYYIGDCYLSTGNTVYIIEELPSGLYYLRTSSSYYINEYYDNTISWHEATLVQVVDAQVTSGIDFYLEKSKVIIGYIYEEDGTTPISNMYARFYCYDATSEYDQWDYNYFSRNLTEDGEFILSGISFPEVKIKAFIEGYKPEFHNNADTWDNASGITVTGMNDTIININFFLSPVTAVQDSYEPNNTHFNAYEITYGDTVNPQINPEYDIDYFKFVGQEDDTVTISIFADIYGSGLYPFLYLIDSTGTDRLDKCDGRDSKITNYVLPYTGLYFLKIRDDLYRGGENCSYLLTIIKGTVFIEGISGAISGRIYEPDGITPYIGYASIDAYDTITGDDVSDDFISSSDSGLYTISDLPAGDYKIRIYSWSDIYLRQWYNGVQNWEEAAIVSVMDRDTTSDVNITLEYGGLISGRIYQSDGITPYIGSAEIDAYDAITSDYVSDDYISSSDSGCYTFGELAGGNYKIRIYIYDDSDTYTNQWYNGVQNREEATNVLVNIPDTTKNINFTLKQGGTIQGFIYSTDGSERITEDSLDVSVIFYNSVTGKYAGYGYNTFTGGYKETGLWPGSYKIATTGFSSNLAPVFYGGGTVYDDPNSSTITLVAGEVKDIDLNIATGS